MVGLVTSPLVLLIGLSLLPPATVQESEIVVRGRLKPFRGDAAFSTLTVARPAIEAASSLDEALKAQAQASLFRRQSSLSANPTIQGMSLRAIAPSGAGRALVTLDGVPQNDPFGGWVIWASVPVDAIDRARVVRGAGGGAYGAGALTGVVDLDLSPTQAGVSGGLDWGDSGTWGAQINAGLGGLGLHYSRAFRFGDAAVRSPQRGAADEGVFGDDEAALATWRTEVRMHNLTLMAGRYNSRRDTGLSGATARASGHQYALSLTRPTAGTGNGYRLQLWYRDSDLANRSVSVLSGRGGTTLANDQFATPAEGYGLNAAWRHEDATGEWEAGIDVRRSDGRARERLRFVSGMATRYREAGGRTELAGIYVQASQRLDQVSLTAAARADRWTATRGFRHETDLSTGASVLDLRTSDAQTTVVSARLGITRQTGPQQWRAGVYNGFRPPSLNELYRPFRVGNDLTEANSALKPEKLNGVEVGWRYAANGLSIDLGLFHNRLRDPISNITVGVGPDTFPTAGFVPAGGILRQRQNAGEVRATGLELSGRWQATERLILTLSGTLTDAAMSGGDPALTGKRPAQAPAYLVSMGGNYQLGRTRLGADWLFIGESFEDDLNRQRLSPASRLRLTAERSVTKTLSLRLGVDNALDADIPVQRTADGIISYDNRRAMMLSVRYRP